MNFKVKKIFVTLPKTLLFFDRAKIWIKPQLKNSFYDKKVTSATKIITFMTKTVFLSKSMLCYSNKVNIIAAEKNSCKLVINYGKNTGKD